MRGRPLQSRYLEHCQITNTGERAGGVEGGRPYVVYGMYVGEIVFNVRNRFCFSNIGVSMLTYVWCKSVCTRGIHVAPHQLKLNFDARIFQALTYSLVLDMVATSIYVNC
jgi:hypothetical protein